MALSPMIEQYRQIKAENPDCLLMFRLGDFYELFYEDAKLVSEELSLVLTARDSGDGQRAPMCGVPYHAVEGYLSKLIAKGHRVAVCEQLEDPAAAKGIVKRGVIRIVSPGTVTEGEFLKEGANNYLASVAIGAEGYGIAFADVSTGEVFATEATGEGGEALLSAEFAAFSPTEAVLPESAPDSVRALFKDKALLSFEESEDAEGFGQSLPEDFTTDLAERAVCRLLCYIKRTQKTDLGYIKPAKYYKSDAFMRVDAFSRRNLEIAESLSTHEKKGSLLWVLDKTRTGPGARLLRRWLDKPLLSSHAINSRLRAVSELKDDSPGRQEIRELLKGMVDMERVCTRLVYGSANARDLKALEGSIKRLPALKSALSAYRCEALSRVCENIDELSDVCESIAKTIADDPPVTLREGGIIKAGASASVDELRSMMTEGRKWISRIEAEEKERTGIRTLRVGYNKVFGYYIEVSKSFADAVPDTYIRRQTLVNCERFVTPELRDMEGRVIGAKDKVTALEYELFCALRDYITQRVARIQKTAAAVAEADVFCSLAKLAADSGYVCPEVDDSEVIDIKEGRHPVVEKFMGDAFFVPNDACLDTAANRLLLITGPNMAGKSTYMRQTALIVVMAQIGSFVPAKSARIGVVDRVFTRVGASDDLATGRSTFMTEMTELAAILKNATKKSLVIYDEIGRGTSTYDGMSIARAALEYTAKRIGARTLFATHYHELTGLEGEVDGVVNYNIAAKKRGDNIVFLRKVVRGKTDDSYGIEVAKLAGVPDEVVSRAKSVLRKLESAKPAEAKKAPEADENQSFSAMAEAEIAEKLRQTDINTLTPIEALGLLYELKKKAEI